MVIVKGAFPVKERKRTDALLLLENFAKSTRAETGCVDYEVYSQANEPATIVVWQQWRNMATWETHLSSEQMDGFLDQLALMLDGQAVTDCFSVRAPVSAHNGGLIEGKARLNDDQGGLIAADVTIH